MTFVRYSDGNIYGVLAQMGFKCDGCTQDECKTQECDLCTFASNRVEALLGYSLEDAGITIEQLGLDYML